MMRSDLIPGCELLSRLQADIELAATKEAYPYPPDYAAKENAGE